MAKASAISTKATGSLPLTRLRSTVAMGSATGGATGSATRSISGRPSEQPRGPDQQHDRHDDENHRVGCLREEHLGQSLDDAETEAGQDRAHDRAHAADHYDRKHDDDEV